MPKMPTQNFIHTPVMEFVILFEERSCWCYINRFKNSMTILNGFMPYTASCPQYFLFKCLTVSCMLLGQLILYSMLVAKITFLSQII